MTFLINYTFTNSNSCTRAYCIKLSVTTSIFKTCISNCYYIFLSKSNNKIICVSSWTCACSNTNSRNITYSITMTLWCSIIKWRTNNTTSTICSKICNTIWSKRRSKVNSISIWICSTIRILRIKYKKLKGVRIMAYITFQPNDYFNTVTYSGT